MKKTTVLFAFLVISFVTIAQEYYWVYFTDKNNTEFDPYSYFDDKAIERRQNNNISLYDISDYPVNEYYNRSVNELADEYIGETRWFNAIAVQAGKDEIEQIKEFDFVLKVTQINSQPVFCAVEESEESYEIFEQAYNDGILPQLKAMEGEEFVKNDFDGKGIRIAVFDGGFPDVDTHDAFAHLRENNQIRKTYNFPKKQENVYGWNSHGTMVLSCIAGLDKSGNKMGLATGSEFLLARTEVNAEPAKEEVYWMMAVEWADKNGADVINSSLGYGADRHNPEDMDGQTCLVTRAANMAASKGILVCNAAGNEGDQASWETLGAPADADSILTIGGVEQYSGYHIDFSSYGPTADGRMKPNVSAFGKANIARPGNGFGTAYGTSFASPLVAGFVACAWQTNTNLTAMQLKSEVEKSGNLYPYYDYAVGYGLPRAGCFTGKIYPEPEKHFEIETDNEDIVITITDIELFESVFVQYHIENENKQLAYYALDKFAMSSGDEIRISMDALRGGKTLRVYCDGYIEEYRLGDLDIITTADIDEPYCELVRGEGTSKYKKDVVSDTPSSFGVNSKYYIVPYISLGFATPPDDSGLDIKYGKTRDFNIGLRYLGNVSKWYRLGVNFEYSKTKCFYRPDYLLGTVETDNSRIMVKSLDLEFFQRFRILPGTMTGFGTFVDIGIYGSYGLSVKNISEGVFINSVEYKYVTPISDYNKLNWGLRFGFGRGILSVYGKYRMNDVFTNDNVTTVRIPKIEAGLEFAIPLIMN